MSQLLQYYKSFQQSRNPLPTLAPTFEDLSIDDNLSSLQRLLKYVKSSIGLQRLVHVKMLGHICSVVGFTETKAKIFPLLEGLSHDAEPAVKQHFVDQLGIVAKFCVSEGGEEGYLLMISKLLPITARLLEDDKEVRSAACITFCTICTLARPDDVGQHILTVVLRLAHEDEHEELRMTACELLNSLAECMGPDLCRQFIIPEIVSLAEDPAFRVRKSAALNFHNICKVGGEHELFERLMPAFVRLSKDDMYRVRRACAENLSEISKNVSNDIRIGVLVECFLRLTQDPSRVVKQSVLQQSGMFIATLPKRYVSENILSYFISMASDPMGDPVIDPELKHYCAFSFPAVLQTIGGARWKELRFLYQNLLQSNSVAVKKTLAASLHEVARILSNESLVEEELVPVFEDMIQDDETVRLGIIKNLAQFLRLLSEPCRISYLPLLHDILHDTNPFHWRFRQHLAMQLPELIVLPPPEKLYNLLFPLIISLVHDPVAAVRQDSYFGVAKLLNVLLEQSQKESAASAEAGDRILGENKFTEQFETVVKKINELIYGDYYQFRQLWFEISHRLLRELPQNIFEKYFIDGILILCSDPVCNVRIAASVFLSGWAPEDRAPWEIYDGNDQARPAETPGDVPQLRARPSPWTWLLRRMDIRQCVHRLSRDDRDVCVNMAKLQPFFKEVTFSQISCRGYQSCPGGTAPVLHDNRMVDENNPTPFTPSPVNPNPSTTPARRLSARSTSTSSSHASDEEPSLSTVLSSTIRSRKGSSPEEELTAMAQNIRRPSLGASGSPQGSPNLPAAALETIMVEYPPLPPSIEIDLAHHEDDSVCSVGGNSATGPLPHSVFDEAEEEVECIPVPDMVIDTSGLISCPLDPAADGPSSPEAK